MVQVSTFTFSLCLVNYLKPHHPRTWPGISSLWKESVKIEPVLDFLRLSSGGVTLYTEWLFWEAICFVAGRLGVVPLAIHSVGYQVIPVAYMIPLGLNIGMTVRMGALLSKNQVDEAKRLVRMVLILVFFLATLVCFLVFTFREQLIGLFTKDEKVVQGSRMIWPYLCGQLFFMFYYCINSGIMKALGKQWFCGGVIVLNLWIISLPTTIYVAVVRNEGLLALWKIVVASYLVLNICLVISYTIFTDWNDVAKQILIRNANAANSNTDTASDTNSEYNSVVSNDDLPPILAQRAH